MKVLFVASGNSEFYRVAPFIKSQGDSLREWEVEVTYFPVIGKGALNYLKNAMKLRRYLRDHPCDVIHAHYSLCGWVAVLAMPRQPVVLSLMGDDAQGTFVGKDAVDLKSRALIFLSKMVQPFVQALISKSPNLEKAVYRNKISYLIPNGVRLDQFSQTGKDNRKALGLRKDRKYVLFLANPEDPNKNIALARSAVGLLNRPDVELLNVYKVPHDQVVQYLHAADVFVMCSFGEGSPNVVKEAMACNCPMVVTDVGDVRRVVGKTPGCFIASFEAEDFARALSQALTFAETSGRTRGRQRIIELGLDAGSVAGRLVDVYRRVLGTSQPLPATHQSVESKAP